MDLYNDGQPCSSNSNEYDPFTNGGFLKPDDDYLTPDDVYTPTSNDSLKEGPKDEYNNNYNRTIYNNGTLQLTITEEMPTPTTAPSKVNMDDQPDEIVKGLSGVGDFLNALRGIEPPAGRKRVVLDSVGRDITISRKPFPLCKIGEVNQRVAFGDLQEPCDLPPPPEHPTTVREVRKKIRSKMIRCKRCKNRFIERNIYERHLRDRHPQDYLQYVAEQEAEMEEQRVTEIEANRIEELQTGGFIPPESEIESNSFEVEVDGIPLPGENNGGVAPRFDSFGGLKQIKRPYRKKVSPQCPFCDKRYRNEYSLKKHLHKKHPEMNEFQQCTSCFKCVENGQELKDHTCELTYICFECIPIRNLCTDTRLLNHRKKFHRGVNSGFKCNLCPLKFLTPRKLRKHKKMSHVFTKTYQCHFCTEIFISEVGVMTHERVHTGIIKFECKICDYKCSRWLHMEQHSKEEHGYICSICKEKCTEWSEMKDHTLNVHGGYLSSDQQTRYIDSPRVWIMFKGD